MTQDILGVKSNVDKRTIQRAETGKPMQMESLAGIASALNVPLSQIIESAEKKDGDGDDGEDLAAQSLIVLRPVESGMALINTIHGSFDGKITCEAEPTVDNIDVLTAITSAIEGMMPDPWRPADEPDFLLSAKLRHAVDLNGQLKQLDGFDIAVYVATYTAQAMMPSFDMDTGEMYISHRTPLSLVNICRIMIAPTARGDRITLKVDDLYVPPKAPVFEPADMEDIPF